MASRPQITVTDAESMAQAIRLYGIIPLFATRIPGYSIEELTPEGYLAFDGPDGIISSPWDWKVTCVQTGEFAYGKFLLGGKAAFATIEWYKELRQWRMSQPRYKPDADCEKILSLAAAQGSVSSRDIRKLLGINKSKADAFLSRLQMGCRLVTGDIQRVYRGPDLEYKGWQTASFCTPESLFDTSEIAKLLNLDLRSASLDTGHSPRQARQRLAAHIRTLVPDITDPQLTRLIG